MDRGRLKIALLALLGLAAICVFFQCYDHSFPLTLQSKIIDQRSLNRAWEWIALLDPYLALLAVFLLLLLAGCGLPMPEDIPLTFAGILLSVPDMQEAFGGFNATLAVILAGSWISILSGDLVAYWYGYRFGDSVATLPFFKHLLNPRKRKRLDRWFHRFGSWTVFLGRMMAGIRIITFVTAGIARMRLSRFIMFDLMGAMITVPAWLFLGHVIGSNFESILMWTARINKTAWAVVAVLVLLIFLVPRLVRKRKGEDES